jgi:hypothetical protein
MPDFKAYPKRPQNAFGSHSNSHGLTAGECQMPNGSTGKDVDLVWLPKGIEKRCAKSYKKQKYKKWKNLREKGLTR